MSMEVTAWMSLHHAMHAAGPAAVLPGDPAADRRLRPPAPPPARVVPGAQRRGRGAGGRRRRCWPAGWSTRSSPAPTRRRWCRLAVLIAVIAVAEAGLGLLTRWLSARIGEGLILDLRDRRLRPRAADAGRVLHPHPHRRAGQPAQQRRDRRAAGVQRHAVRRGRQRRHAGADARRDARPVLADHPARAGAAADLRAARPGGWAPAGPAASGRRPTTTRRWAPR